MSAAEARRGLVDRVLLAWLDPRDAMARELAARPDEPQLLAYVMGGCMALLLAETPRIFVITPAVVAESGAEGVFGYFLANLVSFLFFAPLFLYGVAAAARGIARAFGGTGGWRETRHATFWAILVAAPAILAAALADLALTLLGALWAAAAVNYAVGLAAAWIWAACLAEAHGFRRIWPVFAVQIAIAAAVVALVLAATRGAPVTA